MTLSNMISRFLGWVFLRVFDFFIHLLRNNGLINIFFPPASGQCRFHYESVLMLFTIVDLIID